MNQATVFLLVFLQQRWHIIPVWDSLSDFVRTIGEETFCPGAADLVEMKPTFTTGQFCHAIYWFCLQAKPTWGAGGYESVQLLTWGTVALTLQSSTGHLEYWKQGRLIFGFGFGKCGAAAWTRSKNDWHTNLTQHSGFYISNHISLTPKFFSVWVRNESTIFLLSSYAPSPNPISYLFMTQSLI